MGVKYNFAYTCDKCGKEFTDGIELKNKANSLIKNNNRKLITYYENGGYVEPVEICYCNECFIKMLKGENN